MKKKNIILIILLIAVAGAAFWYFRSGKNSEDISFITATVQYGYIGKSITATGTVEPLDTVSVGAQVSGVVKKVFVDFNSVVKKGQLLATVDASILTAQAEEAKANLANTKSNLEFQKNTFERQSRLFDLGAISKADYQLALNQYNSAKAATDNASAQLQVTEKTLSYTNIYSPVDGVVLNRNVSEGQTIASSFNAPVLFVIAEDLTRMQVNADVDEADIGGVVAGQHVSFTVDAFPNDIFTGKVKEVLLHPSVSANVVTYATLINVDNTGMKLKPGMTASISIYTEEDSNALLIPANAVSLKPDSSLLKKYTMIKTDGTGDPGTGGSGLHPHFVWIKKGDTLTEKKILTGLADDTHIAVVKGLSAGDEIITGFISGRDKKSSDKTQRSPFIPQTRQRPSNPPKN